MNLETKAVVSENMYAKPINQKNDSREQEQNKEEQLGENMLTPFKNLNGFRL